MFKQKFKGVLYIEFAVILPIFLLLLFNIIFGAIMLYDYNSAQEFARIRARHIAGTIVNNSGITFSQGDNNVVTLQLSGNYVSQEEAKIVEVLNRRMLMYRVDANFFNTTNAATGNSNHGVQVLYRQNKGETAASAATDNEVWLQVKAKIYKPDDAVPFIASAICPGSFEIQQIGRLEK